MARVPELMTAQICARFLGISEPTLLKWIRSGTGPPRIRVSKSWRYSKEALKEWLKTGGASSLLPRAAGARSQTPVGSPSFASPGVRRGLLR